MNVLLLGATGFIGRHIARALARAGHRVVEARRPQYDLARDHDAHAWLPRLEGIDVVVNAAGAFRDRGSQTLEAIHSAGPRALFHACAQRAVPVVQVSALGADAGAASRFHRTKREADEELLALEVPSVVLQPSLVYGPGGESAALFATMASLPLVPLPGAGGQRIQPVHVEDLAEAVARIVDRRHFPRARVAAVGPAPTTLGHFLATLRAAMGLGRARFLPMPMALVRSAASLRAGGLLGRDSLAMLERGNVADPAPLTALLGRAPRDATHFVDPERAAEARTQARLGWLLPLLRVAIALVWIIAGVVSAGLYPVEESLALLARTGITGSAAYVALYGAAALDLAIGVATIALRRRRWLWLLQAAIILGYTAIITVALPEQWLHPYGPVAKNLPMLAAIWLLYEMEKR